MSGRGAQVWLRRNSDHAPALPGGDGEHLLRLAKEGAADTFQGSVSNGPVRKYYRLTDSGRERLAKMAEDWRRLREILETLGIA